jgi:hypothetical protein
MEEPSLKILRRFLLAVAIILMSFGVVNVALTQQNINRGIVETTVIQYGADRLEGTQVAVCVCIVDQAFKWSKTHRQRASGMMALPE